jgi:hypothetical protein
MLAFVSRKTLKKQQMTSRAGRHGKSMTASRPTASRPTASRPTALEKILFCRFLLLRLFLCRGRFLAAQPRIALTVSHTNTASSVSVSLHSICPFSLRPLNVGFFLKILGSRKTCRALYVGACAQAMFGKRTRTRKHFLLSVRLSVPLSPPSSSFFYFWSALKSTFRKKDYYDAALPLQLASNNNGELV